LNYLWAPFVTSSMTVAQIDKLVRNNRWQQCTLFRE
jgi:hypothetical protein